MERKITTGRFEVIRNTSFQEKKVEHRQLHIQQALFPWPNCRALIFVQFPEVTDDQFLSVLEGARPNYVFELRGAPRFDVGRLNRKAAFEAFKRNGSTYLDVGSSERGTALEQIRRVVKGVYTGTDVKSPIMFLVNASQFDDFFAKKILQIFELESDEWDVCSIPGTISETSKAAG